MKYTTKRSKVEELVIDLEDGCIIRVTPSNIMQTNICPNNIGINKSYNVSIGLNNGVIVNLKQVDEQFVNDLNQVFPR